MKQCSICKEIKSISDFGNHKIGKDGLRSECKSCSNRNYVPKSGKCETCGKRTNRGAIECSECLRTRTKDRTRMKDLCKCGSLKYRNANQCMNCYVKSIEEADHYCRTCEVLLTDDNWYPSTKKKSNICKKCNGNYVKRYRGKYKNTDKLKTKRLKLKQ